MRLFAAATLWLGLITMQASAGPAADLLARHAYDGTLADGVTALGPLVQKGDAEASAARGALKLLIAVEHVSQSLYRHGLETTQGGLIFQLPVLRIPVPPNPHPEKLDYAGFRGILGQLVDDLDAAEADLSKVGDADVKLPLDLARLTLDLDGDGKATADESLGAILKRLNRDNSSATVPAIAFDTADIYWLRGYDRFISGFAQFLLAFNFQETFDKTFQLYFPHAGLPLAGKLPRGNLDPWVNAEVADTVSFIHLISWDIVEPARLKDVRVRLKAMAEMSRQSWAAARRETDNDREWMPNAKQELSPTGLAVTDSLIDGWLAVMAEFEAVLDGKKLLPHWRFQQGLNAKRMFDEMQRFDLVLLIAGPDAVPWLEDGPVSDTATWARLTRVFQGNFLGYTLFFN